MCTNTNIHVQLYLGKQLYTFHILLNIYMCNICEDINQSNLLIITFYTCFVNVGSYCKA